MFIKEYRSMTEKYGLFSVHLTGSTYTVVGEKLTATPTTSEMKLCKVYAEYTGPQRNNSYMCKGNLKSFPLLGIYKVGNRGINLRALGTMHKEDFLTHVCTQLGLSLNEALDVLTALEEESKSKGRS